ncbi:MAG: ABC transporter substrate-binding protein [Christensenellaceae bacterium]|jgi:branched-chain amino acid transport system substrate-binding protein|nr:ABC transporter substrate-binding protein [Christensenellaceae bacterium]
MKKLLSLFVALAMMLSLTACTTGAPNSTAPAGTPAATVEKPVAAPGETGDVETIKIGVLFPMSGGSASSGNLSWMGTQMAVDYFNNNGGFKNLNAAVELVLIDTETKPDVAASAFERLVTEENVIGVVGNFNSATSATCVPMAIKYGVPYIISACANDNLMEQENDYVYRVGAGNAEVYQKRIEFIQWLGNATDVKTGSIIYSADDFGAQTSESWASVLKDAGIDIILTESIQGGASDLSGIVNKLKASDPDLAIVVLNTNEAVLFQKGLKEYNCNVPILAGGAGYMEPTFIDTVGKDAAEYVFVNTGWIPDSLSNSPAVATDLVNEALAKYGYEFAEASMYAWASTAVLIDAIDRAGVIDREAVAQALKTTDLDKDHWVNMYTNLSGIKFGTVDGRYNVNVNVLSFCAQVVDGEWRIVWPDDNIADNPLVWPIPNWDER